MSYDRRRYLPLKRVSYSATEWLAGLPVSDRPSRPSRRWLCFKAAPGAGNDQTRGGAARLYLSTLMLL